MIKKYNPIKDNIVDKIDEMRKEINRLLKNKIKVIETKPRFQYPICPKCKSKDVKKGGVRGNLGRGDTQRFYCKNCKYHFTPKTFEYHMRTSKNKINKAFELRHQGLSYSQIAKRISGISRQTIHRWIKKYKIPLKEREVEIEIKSKIGKKPYKRNFKIKC